MEKDYKYDEDSGERVYIHGPIDRFVDNLDALVKSTQKKAWSKKGIVGGSILVGAGKAVIDEFSLPSDQGIKTLSMIVGASYLMGSSVTQENYSYQNKPHQHAEDFAVRAAEAGVFVLIANASYAATRTLLNYLK